jgi:hypothetical protein
MLLRGRRKYIHVGLVATSLSLIPRKSISDAHTLTVFVFLISRPRFLNLVNTLEASDDSPRDFQGRLPKKD